MTVLLPSSHSNNISSCVRRVLNLIFCNYKSELIVWKGVNARERSWPALSCLSIIEGGHAMILQIKTRTMAVTVKMTNAALLNNNIKPNTCLNTLNDDTYLKIPNKKCFTKIDFNFYTCECEYALL